MATYSNDPLKQLVERSIKEIFLSGVAEAPISVFDLLSLLVSRPSAAPNSQKFRFTDLNKLEKIIEDLAENWDAGNICLLRDDDGLHVMQVTIFNSNQTQASLSRKRKRAVDEDADSAEEEAAKAVPVYSRNISPGSSLASLSKETQEIYALLQRGTARHRLLTEQASRSFLHNRPRI